MGKVWNVKKQDLEKVESLSKKFKISMLLAQMLVAKEIDESQIDEFLNPDLDKLNNPYELPDMRRLVDRVLKARENNEKIVIYGDYDVDGITSITVLYLFLRDIGITPSYYLPDRLEEGYGLNNAALESIKAQGADLVITVDCGISAHKEAEFAKSLGLDLIITDHHECTDDLPYAIAVVNPKRHDSNYPCEFLAGVGVTFKVITALAQALNMDSSSYFHF